jgi:DNA-binding NarL/FixJ family response regulator
MTGPIRVVIAEDHFLFREGTRQLLEASRRIEVTCSRPSTGFGRTR